MAALTWGLLSAVVTLVGSLLFLSHCLLSPSALQGEALVGADRRHRPPRHTRAEHSVSERIDEGDERGLFCLYNTVNVRIAQGILVQSTDEGDDVQDFHRCPFPVLAAQVTQSVSL